MHQLLIPGLTGLERRDVGAASVLENVGDDWRRQVRRVICELAVAVRAGVLPALTGDHVRAEAERRGIPEPHHWNAYGAALIAAAKAGVIQPTGQFVRSRRPEAHGRRIAVWTAAGGDE